jgi:hypothetical protein
MMSETKATLLQADVVVVCVKVRLIRLVLLTASIKFNQREEMGAIKVETNRGMYFSTYHLLTPPIAESEAEGRR